MPEEIQPIKSLDELEQGDVVSFEIRPRTRVSSFIVEAIGEVPKHEKEVLLLQLYPPHLQNSEVKYDPITIKESELNNAKIEKLKREDYSGWKYLTVARI